MQAITGNVKRNFQSPKLNARGYPVDWDSVAFSGDKEKIQPPGMAAQELLEKQEQLYRFLRRVLNISESKDFELYYFLHNDQLSYMKAVDLPRLADMATSSIGDWYFALHAYNPQYPARIQEKIVCLNAIVVDIDGGELDAFSIEERLDDLGIKSHYILETSPGRFQVVFLEGPERVGKMNRGKTLELQGKVIERLYGRLGGDMSAAQVNQLFRLAYTARLIDDPWENPVFRVRVVAESDHPRYTLRELLGKTDSLDTQKKVFSVVSGGLGHVLETPALRWIQEKTIAEGYRNTSAYALSNALRMDGLSQGEAWQRLSSWRENHTAPIYPAAEARAVLKSAFAHPRGLNAEKLQSIETVDGEVMSEEQAKTIYSAMPNIHRSFPRKSLEELQNKPLIFWLFVALRAIKEHTGSPLWQVSGKEFSEQTGIPYGTVINRIFPALKSAKLCFLSPKKRPAFFSSGTRTFNNNTLLTTIKCNTLRSHTQKATLRQHQTHTHPYRFINRMLKKGWYRRKLRKVLVYWSRRFAELWSNFCQLFSFIKRKPEQNINIAFEKHQELGSRTQTRGPPDQIFQLKNS